LTTPTSKIILNAVELDFDEVMIHLGDHSVPSESIVFDETYETATIEFAAVLAPGRATLSIKFHGVLNEQLHGFYGSTDEDTNGQQRSIATTQFAPTDARRAFPCWDDPARKATFQLTLVIPSDLAAFSNTSEISSTLLDDGRREISFAAVVVDPTQRLVPRRQYRSVQFVDGELR
jgi:aminopeptidase N